MFEEEDQRILRILNADRAFFFFFFFFLLLFMLLLLLLIVEHLQSRLFGGRGWDGDEGWPSDNDNDSSCVMYGKFRDASACRLLYRPR